MRSLSLIMASVALAVTVTASGPAAARRHDPEKLPVTRIRDLHYGDVLFYFYQDDDFEAITRLTAYQHWNLIPHHEEEASCCSAACICPSACTTRRASVSRPC